MSKQIARQKLGATEVKRELEIVTARSANAGAQGTTTDISTGMQGIVD